MKVRILHKFHDKADFRKVYLVDETITFDDARAEYLIGRGLVERIEDNPAPKEEQPLFVEETPIKPVATRRRTTAKVSK